MDTTLPVSHWHCQWQPGPHTVAPSQQAAVPDGAAAGPVSLSGCPRPAGQRLTVSTETASAAPRRPGAACSGYESESARTVTESDDSESARDQGRAVPVTVIVCWSRFTRSLSDSDSPAEPLRLTVTVPARAKSSVSS
jgi:hypothetical protein